MSSRKPLSKTSPRPLHELVVYRPQQLESKEKKLITMKSWIKLFLIGSVLLAAANAVYIHSWSCTVDGIKYNDGDIVPVSQDPECWVCRCHESGDRSGVMCANEYCPSKGPGK
ncbi:unnamed protein product [Lymnaea stagnalis]|uniref:Pacifastin domain-containing protein n=1 Tax=Lymnaea stagnalis TaxID=6523 RepID=A0AAV2HBG5_LYMST